jgi:hypothetical protein
VAEELDHHLPDADPGYDAPELLSGLLAELDVEAGDALRSEQRMPTALTLCEYDDGRGGGSGSE